MFQILITGKGDHGCDRKSEPGGKLHKRCGKFGCPDCMAYDFVQQLRMRGIGVRDATFTHHVGAVSPDAIIVDDILENTRKSGQF